MKMNPDAEKDEYAEFVEKYSADILDICAISGTSAWELCEAIRDLCNKIAETGKQINETLKPLLENPPEDIPRLKKQIKHCKNPLEEKALRKRLNEATRNSRRRNKIGSR
jgi:hypothetical protein